MSAAFIDTYGLFNKLKSSGFTEAQAAGITEAIREVDLDSVATKSDVERLAAATKSDVERLETRVVSDMEKLEMRMTIKTGVMMMALAGFLSYIKFFTPAA